jgi:hypothetical protein
MLLFHTVLSAQASIMIFRESIGSTQGGNTSIANTVFDNTSPIVFSGTADTRTTTPSTDYTGASGGRNVFFSTNGMTHFLITGIDTSTFQSLSLRFGHYKKHTTANNELAVEVSADGTHWNHLSYNRTTGSGTANWTLISPSGTIPSTSNLHIRFRQTSNAFEFRVDDIQLSGAPIHGYGFISPSTSFCSFSMFEGGPSRPSSFLIDATNLTTSITITAPHGFEVSNDEIHWGATTTLAPFGGLIFIRLKQDLPPGEYAGTVSLESSETSASISVSGLVTANTRKITERPYRITEDFSGFTNATSLPPGWRVESTGDALSYIGNWGTNNTAGLRGNHVLGYQHTEKTGIFSAILTIENRTDTTIRELLVQYTGKVARIAETRTPAWTVSLNGAAIHELSYNTAEGVDVPISHLITGLKIHSGDTFSITWTSERGDGSGASRQIGISDVFVAAPNIRKPTVITVR